MATHHTTMVDHRKEKVTTIENTFVAAPINNRDDEGGKNPDIQSMRPTQSYELKGKEVDLDLNLHNKIMGDCDATCAVVEHKPFDSYVDMNTKI